MRIAIDGRTLTGRFTGDRTYWRNLLQGLSEVDETNEFLVYSRDAVPAAERVRAPNFNYIELHSATERLWTLRALPSALRKDRADVVHVQYTAPPRAFCPCPVVTTVHDISFRLYPQWFPPLHRTLLNLTVPASMRRAARVITVSESSRTDILETYHLPPEKVVAILHGLPSGYEPAPGQSEAILKETSTRFAKQRLGTERPFILAVGVLQPRKNLRMLAEAFGIAVQRYSLPHVLVFAGKAGWGTEQEALRLAAESGGPGSGERILFPGYVEDDSLPHLYRACALFAYPSLYEGFGLPPLEAMAASAPVLVSDRPALPEVVGDAAMVLPATDASAWAEAMGRLLTDGEMRDELAARGPAHARKFTWRASAQKTFRVYQEATNASGY